MMVDLAQRDAASSPRDERGIADLAARQHGVVGGGQLLALGFTASSIGRRLTQGRLHLMHRGVYAVGHPLVSADGRRLAALLACGDEALLSHVTSAAAWSIRHESGGPCHVVVPMARGHRSRPGLVVHHSRTLTEDDAAIRNGLRLTSVARTLLDLGDVVPPDQVRRAFVGAEQQRVLDMTEVDGVLARAGRRRGARVLLELLGSYDPRWQAVRSELELRMLDLVTGSRLPEPEVNTWVGGRFMVDFLWAGRRLIVETDGAFVHGTATARREDARRDQALRRLGFRVLRFSYADVVMRGDHVARRLRDELTD